MAWRAWCLLADDVSIPPGLAAAGQLVTVTTLCEAGRCHLCPGTSISATPADGQPCGHYCRQADDAATEAMLEAKHVGYRSLFDLDGDAASPTTGANRATCFDPRNLRAFLMPASGPGLWQLHAQARWRN